MIPLYHQCHLMQEYFQRLVVQIQQIVHLNLKRNQSLKIQQLQHHHQHLRYHHTIQRHHHLHMQLAVYLFHRKMHLIHHIQEMLVVKLCILV